MSDLVRLVHELAANDVTVRRSAAESISRLSEFTAPVLVALVRAAGDDDEVVREFAVSALESQAGNARDAGADGSWNKSEFVEELAGLLRTAEFDCAYWAATLLGRLGSEASPALERLADSLHSHPQLAVRERSAWAIGRVGGRTSRVIKALEEAASASEPRLARLAKEALANSQS